MALTDKQIALLKDKNTVCLIPHAHEASDISKNFLEANAPSVIAEQRVFDELHLMALNQDMQLVFVFHSPRKPIYEQFKDVDGTTQRKLRVERELMDEVVVTAPIKPKYTREHPMKPAILDLPAFFEDCSKATNLIRLDAIDKGEAKPQVYRLSWC